MIAVLTTTARPQYLEATLVELEAAPGDHDRHVFFDGHAIGYQRHGWRTHEITKVYDGNAAAIWSVLRFAAKTGEDLVFMEDDIEPVANAIPYLEAFRVPKDLGLVAFMSEFTSEVCPWGLYRAPGGAFMLCQCLKISAAGITAILAAREAPTSRHGDTEIGKALSAAGLRWGAHVPDLVRHVGEISFANPGHPLELTRIGRTFPKQGPTFDAVKQLKSATQMGLYT